MRKAFGVVGSIALYTIRALVALWLLAFYVLCGDIEGFDRWRRWLDGQLKD